MRLGRRRLAEAGCSIPQIAAITAHSIKTIETILERYLIRTGGLARTARWATDHRHRQRSCQTPMCRTTLSPSHHMGAGNHARLSHKRWITRIRLVKGESYPVRHRHPSP